jgi:hypothetical protein
MNDSVGKLESRTSQEMAALRARAEARRARGDAKGADKLFQKRAQVATRRLGGAHLVALTAVYELAAARAEDGNDAGANAAVDALLDALPRTFEHAHADLLQRLHNLSGSLMSTDRSRARKLLQRVVDAKVQALGPDDPSTLRSQNVLASILVMDRDFARARPLLSDVTTRRLEVLGADHPDTLRSMNAMSTLMREVGEFEAALQMSKVVFEARRVVLGPENVETQNSMINYAEVMLEVGDLPGAETMYRELIDLRERSLGAAHPETMRARARMDEISRGA